MTQPNDNDDEWEYEYDETSTEDFYIPLDLSNVPGAQVPMVSQGSFGHPTLLKSRLRALNVALSQGPAETSIEIPAGQEDTSMGTVQITGLHTTNPLVMYNGQLLSCHWTATIGTDMFFVKPDTGVGEPLRSLPAVDLISLGSAKLVAKAGRLRPRDDLFEDVGGGTPSSPTNEQDVQDSTTQATSTEPASQSAKSAPTGFLAKLNLAKEKRGDKNRLATLSTSDGTRLVSEPVRD
ncbi:hypothetical protein NX059_004508 [Plenodomus lindquistii]|nr:hypothetical protein NX059_004508 [Plenodomus lindquistii]